MEGVVLVAQWEISFEDTYDFEIIFSVKRNFPLNYLT